MTQKLTPAQTAIHAAQHLSRWGSYATRQYCLKRGVSLSLYRLACQLEAAARAGIISPANLKS